MPASLGVGQAIEVAIDLEQGVVDRVVQPRSLGAGELVVEAAMDGVIQVLQRSLKLGRRADRRGLVLVGYGAEEPALGGGGGWRCGACRRSRRAWFDLGEPSAEPFQQEGSALRGTRAFHAGA